MANGIISLGTSGKLTGRIVWSSTPNGTDKNSSQVTGSIQAKRTNTGYTTSGTWTGLLNIGGTSKNYSVKKDVSSDWVTLYSFTITKAHNTNGSGTCYISGQIKGPSGTSMAGVSIYNNDTVTLDIIPRQATLTAAPNFTDEENPTITYTNPAGTAVDALAVCISLTGSIDDVAYRPLSKTGTSFTFSGDNAITAEELTTLRKATIGSNSRTVYFYLRTTIGDTNYYNKLAKTFTIVNSAPTLSPTIEDANDNTFALTNNRTKFIKYYSGLAFTTGATAKKDATIASQSATCGNKVAKTASDTLVNIEANSVKFSVTDNRKNTTEKTVALDLVEYVKLTCSMAGTNPTAEGNMTLTVKGNYFNGSFGAVNNALTVEYRYKITADSDFSEWATMTPTINGNTYTATAALTGLDYEKAHTFQARAVDTLMARMGETVETPEKVVKSVPVFDWSSDDFQFNTLVKLRAGKAIRSKTNDGTSEVNLMYLNSADNVTIGGGNAPPEKIFLTTKNNAFGDISIGGKSFGVQKTLWSNALYMIETHTATLSEAISAQINGIVLVFQVYANGAVASSDFNTFFIPKESVVDNNGQGRCFICTTTRFGKVGIKYLYISDTKITGHAQNDETGTAASGITYTNNGFVLTKVYGV